MVKVKTKTSSKKGSPEKSSKKAKDASDYADDDDYEDDDSDDDEYEETKSSKKSKKNKGDKKSKKGKKSKRADDDGDDDEPDIGLKGGWGAYEEEKARASDYPNEMKLTDNEPSIVRFLDDAPLVTFSQHWIERKGKKSFVCLNKSKNDTNCPLCDIGEKVQVKNVFNVVAWVNGDPIVQIMTIGPMLTDQIQAALKRAQKRNPQAKLSDMYVEIIRSGKGGKTNFSVKSVKVRDLEEDYEIKPVSDKKLAELVGEKWKQKQVVNVNTRKELADIAKESVGDYDEDDD
jgi:hypothetical protein